MFIAYFVVNFFFAVLTCVLLFKLIETANWPRRL